MINQPVCCLLNYDANMKLTAERDPYLLSENFVSCDSTLTYVVIQVIVEVAVLQLLILELLC